MHFFKMLMMFLASLFGLVSAQRLYVSIDLLVPILNMKEG